MRQREIEGPVDHQRPAPQVVITCNNPHKLKELLRRERARKAIVVDSAVQQVQPGLWAVRVIQLRPIRPQWVRPAVVVASVASILAALAALGSLFVEVAAGLSATAVVGLGLLLALLLITVRRSPRRGASEVQVDVSVRVRR